MRRTSFAKMNCSIARALEVAGEWWTPLVLREVFYGIRRFDEFQRNLGIARNVLTARLEHLVKNGILERRAYQRRPERYEYHLTAKGAELLPVLVALMRWGDRWTAGAEGPPVVLVHDACGHDARPVLMCSHCREQLRPGAIRPTPGPGASVASRSEGRSLARRRRSARSRQ